MGVGVRVGVVYITSTPITYSGRHRSLTEILGFRRISEVRGLKTADFHGSAGDWLPYVFSKPICVLRNMALILVS